MPTNVVLHLDQLSCVKESEGGSEPYIWPVLIGEEGGIVFLRSPTSDLAGKVLKSGMRAGESVAVPGGLNEVLAAFDTPANALIVVIVAMFEKDASPRHGTAAVLRHIEDRSLAFVQERLAECRQSSGERIDLRNELIRRYDLAQAETDALSFFERAAAQLSPGGFDDPLGFTLHAFSGSALADRGLTFSLTMGGDQFSLTGTLRLKNFIVLCQAERGAVAQAEAVVKGLQTRRQTLQTQLHHATPQQKPAIVDQIQHIAEVELPPAEAALAAAKAALQACLARFTTVGVSLQPLTRG
jgi:hypothetical protein